jgi:hypothetical protein
MPFKSDFVTKNINDTWAMLKEDLVFCSSWMKKTFTVKAGFVTDYASVPRLPIIYMLCGGRGKRAATMHDDGYAKQEIPKRCVDLLFFEGMIDTFVQDAILSYSESSGLGSFFAFWKIVWRFFLAFIMYVGVVFGGWSTWLTYTHRKKVGLPLRPEAPECHDDRWEDRVF